MKPNSTASLAENRKKANNASPKGQHEKEAVLKTVTEVRMAIALLLIYRDKLKKGSDQSWVFKNEVYTGFNFHPQTLTDFLNKLERGGLFGRNYSWKDQKFGGPGYRPSQEGEKVLEEELKSLFDDIKALFHPKGILPNP